MAPTKRSNETGSKPLSSKSKDDDHSHCLNLLLFPWPKEVAPSDFECTRYGPNAGDKVGYFSYNVRGGEPLQTKAIIQLFRKAQSLVGRIDGVVFPELALKDAEHFELHRKISAINSETFVIAGLSEKPKKSHGYERNSWVFVRKSPVHKGDPLVTVAKQGKHHRWRLNQQQIIQYGLGSQLNPEKKWWENTYLGQRELQFFTIHDWLTLCILICEDLARQDPVAELVRTVGPNLVIALLMDGPQLGNRWSARYATVLADDPGSSVLTLTSLGMVQLSRPPGGEMKRTIALWKDAKSGQAREISLPSEKEAVVLCLTRQEITEYTVDGRTDHGAADYLILSGVHYI